MAIKIVGMTLSLRRNEILYSEVECFHNRVQEAGLFRGMPKEC